MTYQCSLENFEAQPAISIRSRTSSAQLPQLFGKTYQALFQYLAENGAHVAGPPFATYYNMDMQNLDIEIGLPINRSLPGKGDVKSSQAPHGKLATVMHVGPYDKVGPAYQALMQWMGQNGHKTTGVSYEIYLDDPQTTAAAKLRTLIAMPVQ